MEQPKRIVLMAPANAGFGRDVVKGVFDYCSGRGTWDILFEGILGEAVVLQRVKAAIMDWKAQGVVGWLTNPGVVAAIRKSGIPSVNVSGISANYRPSVWGDFLAIGQMAAGHFLTRGFTSFAYLGSPDCFYSRRQGQGFSKAIAAAGHRCDVHVPRSQTPWLNQRTALQKWVLSLRKPVAILADSDYCARNLLWISQHLGLRCPEDVALMGVYNDDLECALSTPPLSSVVVSGKQVAAQAMTLLENMIGGAKPPARPVLVKPLGIASRQSSDVLAIEDRDVSAALAFIKRHAHRSVNVRDVVKHCNVSRRTLERRFVELLGRSPKDEIMRVHIERAKTLLLQGDMNIGAVGAACGLAYYPRFTRFFRRLTGMAPMEYRKQGISG